VLAGANRIENALKAKNAGARAVVLDDGFQHQRLHRDLNILLACPEDLDPLTRLLPAGPLREPASQARRADLMAGFERDWREKEEKPAVLFEYAPSCLVMEDWQTMELGARAGARVFLVSGIARPDRFIQTVQSAGFTIAGSRAFKDHHRFRQREIEKVEADAEKSGADAILTTEKDLARLAGVRTRLPNFALRIDLKITSGEELLENKIDHVLTSGEE
jgi:tetraacyldisaccharide 4'-kinase